MKFNFRCRHAKTQFFFLQPNWAIHDEAEWDIKKWNKDEIDKTKTNEMKRLNSSTMLPYQLFLFIPTIDYIIFFFRSSFSLFIKYKRFLTWSTRAANIFGRKKWHTHGVEVIDKTLLRQALHRDACMCARVRWACVRLMIVIMRPQTYN